MGNEVDFLPTDKLESFSQVDSITLGLQEQDISKVAKIASLQCLKENVNDEVDFLILSF